MNNPIRKHKAVLAKRPDQKVGIRLAGGWYVVCEECGPEPLVFNQRNGGHAHFRSRKVAKDRYYWHMRTVHQ